MKKLLFILFFFILLPVSTNSQVSSYKDIVNIYDAYTITLNELTLNTNDEEIKEHAYVVIVTVIIGNEKITKFLYRDDLIMNSVKNYDDVFWSINFTVKRNNTIIIPAQVNVTNSPNSVLIKFEGYSNMNEADVALMSQLSTSFVYCSSNMYNLMDKAYKYLANSPDINRPNSSLLTTAEVLQQNISRRPGIFYLGNPTEVTYVVPQDPKKVIGTNLFVQGKRTVESKIGAKTNDLWIFTVTKLPDVKIVQAEPYYTKIKGVFQDITALQIIPLDRREGYLAKAQEIITDEMVPGRKADVYINDQVSKQFINLMNLLKAGIRVKSDSMQSTSDFMNSNEREALSYFEINLKENDFNLENEYLFDDYINSSVNRGIIQKEIDLVRRYYQIK
ncbi:MAG: hypothetical protein EHM58_19205 [Ignavibacteriae bacterium]|nr:MAG: hypothetical protein EHM58_19205 [Ignavibacteriota bacterium]